MSRESSNGDLLRVGLPASDFRATGRGVTLEWKQDRVTTVQNGKPLVDRAMRRAEG